MPFFLTVQWARNLCLAALFFFALPFAAPAQMASSAAQSPNTAADDFTLWYITLGALGAAFCASIFWWRREKGKSQNFSASRTNTGLKVSRSLELPKLRGEQSPKAAGKESEPDDKSKPDPARSSNEIEVDAAFTNWIQNSMTGGKAANGNSANGHSNPAARVLEEFAAPPAANTSNGKPQSVPTFAVAAAESFLPLPFSDDDSLHDAIEHALDFEASEDERETALNVLAAFKTCNAVEAVAEVALFDASSRLRIKAINVLSDYEHESVFEPILMACADFAREVRAAAARTLARLTFDRTQAFARVVESGDAERLRLASLACVDAGMTASRAFDRLVHADPKQSQEAFAIIRLLCAAGEFSPIAAVLSHHSDLHVRRATIEALRTLKPVRILPALNEMLNNVSFPSTIRPELENLVDELSAAQTN